MASVLNLPLSPPSPHAVLRSKFALYRGSGDLWVISLDELTAYRQGGRKPPEFFRRSAAALLMGRELEALPVACRPSEVIRQFFIDPQTHFYDRLAFSPVPQPNNVLNLWRPPRLHPKRGDWYPIRKHLAEVICDGNRRNFSYLLQYLAHMLQHPATKPGVMIVLLGGQGTGKGALFELLSRIWTHSVLRVSDIEQIAGRFNASLAHAYVVCMDEALFVGDRKSQDKMKSLITEPIISIEQKHQPQHSIESYHRYFAASNHDHFAQIENDDRRYFILKVSSKYQQDNDYFTKLFSAIASDSVIEAFMHVLNNIDLTNFNPRQAPKTCAHAEQRTLSLTRFEKYWYHALWSGELPSSIDYIQEWDCEMFIPTDKLALAATKFDPGSSRYKSITPQEVARELSRLCPSASSTRKSQGYRGIQSRGYDLPTLSVARHEFEVAKGFKVDWGEDSGLSGQTLPLKARLSGSRRANEGAGFKEFARQTRQFELNL
jgi:hypothetical protein